MQECGSLSEMLYNVSRRIQKSPIFSAFLWKVLDPSPENFTGLPLLLLFLLSKPRTSTGTWEFGWEQEAADQQIWDFSCSKRPNLAC